MSKHCLLTGATGLVGQYLLRDLLREGKQVAVLIRSKGSRSAEDRLGHILAHWERELSTNLPRPVCLEGDIAHSGLGMTPSAQRWAAKHIGPVVHNAASLTFTGKMRDAEPWLSNVTGTAHVLDFCSDLKLREFHYMSTAYVCGQREGLVLETDLDCGQEFRNDYEESKYEAEKMVRTATFLDDLTIYRPAIILGDSRTGYTTSYHAFYSYAFFVWMHVQKSLPDETGLVHAPVRLNVTGHEHRNLVPVDWISAAASALIFDAKHHGRTYHLTPRQPITALELESVMADYFQYYGPRFVGSEDLGTLNDLEHFFYSFVNHYQPYWAKEPRFDCTNTVKALPNLPCPRLDAACLGRMLDYAVQDGWGKKRKRLLEKRQGLAAVRA